MCKGNPEVWDANMGILQSKGASKVEQIPQMRKSSGRKNLQQNHCDSLLIAKTGNGHPNS